MKKMKLVILISLITALISCHKEASHEEGPQVQQDVNSALNDNQKAANLEEWHSSDNTPERLFEKWHDQKISSHKVCEELGKISAQELSLFEEELDDKANEDLVKDCKVDLKAKLHAYWESEKKSLEKKSFEEDLAYNVVGPSMPWPKAQAKVGVKLIDTTNGYFTTDGDTKSKELILTFDDGPHVTNTPSILKTLASFGIRATFFAMGNNSRPHPDLIKLEAAAGHSIGSHSITHRCLAAKKICKNNNKGHMLSYAEATGEIAGGAQDVVNAIGWVDPFFRFPYGESSVELKTYLKDNHIGEFYWSIDSEDWKVQSVDHLLTNVLSMLQKHDHGLILMHDIQTRTATVLPTLIEKLAEQGFTFYLMQPKDLAIRKHSPIVKYPN